MKIGLYGKLISNDNVPFVSALVRQLKSELQSEVFIHENLKDIPDIYDSVKDQLFNSNTNIAECIDLLVSFGGDGTLLDTVTMIKSSNVPILGINAGRLGFLANTTQEDINSAVNAIKENNIRLDERTLLEVSNSKDLLGDTCNFALNEITVHKKDSSSMLMVNSYVNEEFLNTYWADGLIIATPTGSTAYSLSCGGPILNPGSENFVITPIAPHNLNLRPMVVGDHVSIELKAQSREGQFFLSIDSRSFVVDNEHPIILNKSDFTIKLVELPDQNFFKTIRNKLFWGKDSRN